MAKIIRFQINASAAKRKTREEFLEVAAVKDGY